MTFDTILLYLICVFGFALVLFATIGLVFINTLNPDARRAWALHKQAMEDYRNARGTAHLKMLKNAKLSLEKKNFLIDKEISSQETKLTTLESSRLNALCKALEINIVNTHFQGESGLGYTMSNLVINRVFTGRLTDLKNAYRVPGIGQARQFHISQWVDSYTSQIPELLKGDFPEKNNTIQLYERKIQPIRESCSKLKAHKEILNEALARAEIEIGKLTQVRPSDFEELLKDPETMKEGIEDYLRGCFAEWESIPDWFKQIISLGASDA